MRFVTKKHMSRRTVLRGLGTALSLPLLDSMVPAQTPLLKTAANPEIKDMNLIYAGQSIRVSQTGK